MNGVPLGGPPWPLPPRNQTSAIVTPLKAQDSFDSNNSFDTPDLSSRSQSYSPPSPSLCCPTAFRDPSAIYKHYIEDNAYPDGPYRGCSKLDYNASPSADSLPSTPEMQYQMQLACLSPEPDETASSLNYHLPPAEQFQRIHQSNLLAESDAEYLYRRNHSGFSPPDSFDDLKASQAWNGNSVLINDTFDNADILLKSSTSSFGQRTRLARSSSSATNPYETIPIDVPILHVKTRQSSDKPFKYSPTPSLKRRTAKQFLEAHGSPPGIRVTCGGRIVPDGPPALTSPALNGLYLGQNAFDSRASPFYANRAVPVAIIPQNGSVGRDLSGRLCQLIDGQAIPVPIKNGVPKFFMPVPNGNIPNGSHEQLPGSQTFHASSPAEDIAFANPDTVTSYSTSNFASKSSVVKQLAELAEYQTSLEREHRQNEKESALHQRTMTKPLHDYIVGRRVELTKAIDEVRKTINALKKNLENGQYSLTADNGSANANANASMAFDHSVLSPFAYQDPGNYQDSAEPRHAYDPYEMPARQYLTDSAYARDEPHMAVSDIYQSHYLGTNIQQKRSGNVGLGIDDVSFGLLGDKQSTEMVSDPNDRITQHDRATQNGRRSHAIQIKDPNQMYTIAEHKASLDPTSPSYVPFTSSFSTMPQGAENIPSNPSSTPLQKLNANKQMTNGSPALLQQVAASFDGPDDYEHSEKNRSSSSANTADFFPHNTADYSHAKQIPGLGAIGSPVTPRRSPRRYAWHSSPAEDRLEPQNNLDDYDMEDAFGLRAPTNRPDAPPPSMVGNSCDLEFIRDTIFHKLSPHSQERNMSAPMASRHAMNFTPTKQGTTMSSPCWKPSPAGSVVGNKEHKQTDGHDLTPISHLLQKASERVAQLPQGTEDFGKGYQHALEVIRALSGRGIAPSPATLSRLQGDKDHSRMGTFATFQGSPTSNKANGAKDLASEFMSKPNVTISSLQQRQMGTQTSHSILRKGLLTPLQMSDSKRRVTPMPVEHQRYVKAPISVDASGAQARGVFQYDGSVHETDADCGASHAGSPKKSKTAPTSPRSPIRAKASAAYAKINKLLGSPKKAHRELVQVQDEEMHADRDMEMTNPKMQYLN